MSGVKTEMAGTLLTWMQDHEAEGDDADPIAVQQRPPQDDERARRPRRRAAGVERRRGAAHDRVQERRILGSR